MGYSETLSNQELQILTRQSGVLVCRYYIRTHVFERLYDSPQQRFGVAAVDVHMPCSVIETGLVSPDTKDVYAAMFASMDACVPSGSMDVKLREKDGEYRWYHGDYSLVYDDYGEPLYALITFFDNTEKLEMKLASEKWRASLSAVLSDAVLYAEINLSKNVMERLEGADCLADIPGEAVESVIRCGVWGPMDAAMLDEYHVFFDRARLLGLFYADVQEDRFDYCIRTENGTSTWLRASVMMMKYPYSKDIMAIISFVKIEGLHKELEDLSHKVSHDALTGLLNREGIDQRVSSTLSCYNPLVCTALFMIDLDDFKQINDRLGHQVGDMVLKQVAETLRSSFHNTDIVGRMGGDEFLVMISGNIHVGFLKKKAVEILAAMQLRRGDERGLAVSASIGIAFGTGRMTFEKLYRTADIALYTAKKAGKARFHVINADTNEEEESAGISPGSDLMTLQTLLNYADTETYTKTRTPYEALVSNIPGGVIIMSIRDGMKKLDHCNGWTARFLGYTPDEFEALEDDYLFALVHPDDIVIMHEITRCMMEGADSIKVTYRIMHKNGHYENLTLSALLTEHSANEIIYYGIHTPEH